MGEIALIGVLATALIGFPAVMAYAFWEREKRIGETRQMLRDWRADQLVRGFPRCPQDEEWGL